ncbi:MAG: RNA polymerase sigma factor [Actinobacteria bacterium]|nr:MAG: RNA polymerase sigma factor [Actinomycetota bacterium]
MAVDSYRGADRPDRAAQPIDRRAGGRGRRSRQLPARAGEDALQRLRGPRVPRHRNRQREPSGGGLLETRASSGTRAGHGGRGEVAGRDQGLSGCERSRPARALARQGIRQPDAVVGRAPDDHDGLPALDRPAAADRRRRPFHLYGHAGKPLSPGRVLAAGVWLWLGLRLELDARRARPRRTRPRRRFRRLHGSRRPLHRDSIIRRSRNRPNDGGCASPGACRLRCDNAGPLRRNKTVNAEQQSFAAIAERHLDDVLAYLMYLTADHALAEDLTVDTFERALRRWNRFDARRGGVRTWLCQLARSAALDHFRSEARRLRREDRYAVRELREVPAPSFGEGLSAELEHALAELSRAEREVVALRVVLELDGDTAARMLGISPSACSTRLSRALQKLEGMVSADAVA